MRLQVYKDNQRRLAITSYLEAHGPQTLDEIKGEFMEQTYIELIVIA